MQIALVNGIHIHYQLRGHPDAPLMVFANSLGTDLRIWDRVLECLGDRVQSLRYDKRGHGLSDVSAAPYTLDHHVDDLDGLLTHLGVSQALVCGISVGGMIAMGLAAKRPEMISGLVLCDTAHKIGSDDFWNQRMDQIRSQGIESIAESVIKRWFSVDFHETYPEEVAGWRNMLIHTPVTGYIGTCAALRDADLTTQAKRIRCPVQCLCGSQDGATPPDLVESMSDLIPDARFETIKEAGHLPCIETPDETAAIIAQFLGEVLV